MDERKIIETSQTQLNVVLAQIQASLAKSPRDIWSKLAAIAPIISGVLVGCIGLYATIVYDARQTEAESSRKERELVVTQVQTLEKFIPHLSSDDERRKEVAILAMAALGNQELAEKVASLYQGSGSAKALATFARSEDAKIADRSRRALSNLGASNDQNTAVAARTELASLLSDLATNVVKILVGGGAGRAGSGFVIAGNDTVVTAAHLFSGSMDLHDILVTSPNGDSTKATLLKLDKEADVAVLRLHTKTSTQGIGFTAEPTNGMAAVILGNTSAGWKSTSGLITNINARITLFPGRQIFAELDSTIGFSGAPVINYDGQLVGMLHASNELGFSVLVPASRIVSVVASIDGGANKRLQPTSAGD